MKRSKLYYLAGFIALAVLGAVAAYVTIRITNSDDDGQSLRGSELEKVECTLYLIDDMAEPGQDPDDLEDRWICVDEETGIEYELEDLTNDFFEENQILSRATKLTVSSTEAGVIVHTVVVLPQPPTTNDGDTGSVPPSDLSQNMTQPTLTTNETSITTTITPTEPFSFVRRTEGQLSMFVVRVTDSTGREPMLSSAELSNSIFGTNGDTVNLRSQYLACSGGKLEFVPAKGFGIVDGVLDVTIQGAVRGVDRSQVQKWTTEILPSYLGNETEKTLFDYTMYVFPAGSDFRGAGAYAATGGRRSVYNDDMVQYLLVQMHEVGHNLGMRHSGYNGLGYDDRTCFLGSHLYANDSPLMCFNGAKSWFLGWYNESGKEGHQLLQPKLSSWEGKLVGIDSYNNNDAYNDQEYKVVLKIETEDEDETGFPDLYAMYNQKVGANENVQKFGDRVTIVSQAKEQGTQSWLEAALEPTVGLDTFRQTNFDNTGMDLVIKVCQITENGQLPAFARVIVYLDNNRDRLEC